MVCGKEKEYISCPAESSKQELAETTQKTLMEQLK
jgi:hypothetical protein